MAGYDGVITLTPNERLMPIKTTSTHRQVAHLKRLANSKGKRLTVDLDAESAQALKMLLQEGYANTQADVVRQSLLLAAKKLLRKA